MQPLDRKNNDVGLQRLADLCIDKSRRVYQKACILAQAAPCWLAWKGAQSASAGAHAAAREQRYPRGGIDEPSRQSERS